MNNIICCVCLECGSEFAITIADLLAEDQDEAIGNLAWCGTCDGHHYACFWGTLVAGSSSDRI
ncbi:MAG: hypothetical protein R3E01_04080 [Pirellulaceae bacterium]